MKGNKRVSEEGKVGNYYPRESLHLTDVLSLKTPQGKRKFMLWEDVGTKDGKR